MTNQEAITSFKILYCNSCKCTDECDFCFVGIATNAIKNQDAIERILKDLKEATFPQKVGGETELIILKKRVDEIIDDSGIKINRN